MKVILIDPDLKDITLVETTGELHDIYKLLECHIIEAPVIFADDDTMYCNEEAWLEYDEPKLPCGFMFKNWTYAILGKSLIIGTGEEGENKDVVNQDINWWKKDIIWCDAEYMYRQGIQMELI